MAISIPPVQSGNIITANLMNQIIQAIENLDSRVTALQGQGGTTAGAPDITSISPTTGLHVGDQLTVYGTNLWAAGVNSVYVDLNGTLTQVTQFTTQSDTTLVFNIPLVYVQGSGSSVYLRIVSPTQGSDAVQFTLLPAAATVPTGQLLVELAVASGTVFNASTTAASTYTLNYTILANTNLGDNYDLNPSVDTTGWSAGIITSSGVQPTSTVYIAAAPSLSQPTVVKGSLQLSIPANATGSAKLTLSVVSHLNPSGLTESTTVSIPVGGSVMLNAGIGVMPQPRSQDLDSSGNLLVPVTGGLQLIFQITAATTGLYNLTWKFDGSGWSATVPSSIQINTANSPTPLTTLITTTAGAQPSNFYLTVSLSTDPTGQTATQVFYPVVVHS